MKIQGRDRLKRRLAAMPDVARAEIRAELERRAADLEETVRRFAPRGETGALKASVGYTFGEYTPENSSVRGVQGGGTLKDKDLSVTVHAGDAKAFYAAFVEFGTAPHAQPRNRLIGYHHPGSSPRPFFFPAYRLSKKKIKAGISRATKRAAAKVFNGT